MKTVRMLPLLLLLLSCAKGNSLPTIEFKQKTLDVGTLVISDENHIYKIPITNTGDQTLRITSSGTDCSCTKIVSIPDSVPGGKSAEIVISINVSELFPMDMKKRLYLVTNACDTTICYPITGKLVRSL